MEAEGERVEDQAFGFGHGSFDLPVGLHVETLKIAGYTALYLELSPLRPARC